MPRPSLIDDIYCCAVLMGIQNPPQNDSDLSAFSIRDLRKLNSIYELIVFWFQDKERPARFHQVKNGLRQMLQSQIPKTKTIRSLERGLEVMTILQEVGPASLKEIYNISGLPRPTLLRILRTLDSAGLVRRGIGDGLYRNSFRLEKMVAKLDETDRLAEIAAPVIDKLCRKIFWPSDLAVLSTKGPYMTLKETSRPSSPFLLNHDQIGHQVNLVLSAVGRAYLAHCSLTEFEILIGQLKATGLPENQFQPNRENFDKILETVRRKGYAIRDSSFGGGQPPFRSQYDDGLDAIAVALTYEGGVIGCLTIAWVRKAASIEEITRDYLKILQSTAREIIDAYRVS